MGRGVVIVAAVVALAAAGLAWLGQRPAAPGSAGAGLRKCVGPGGTTYTDRACPAGSREQVAGGGTLTVVPAPPTAAVAPVAGRAASAAQPLLRQLAPVPDGPTLQQQAIDRIR